MRKRPRTAGRHHSREASRVPLENHSAGRPWQGLRGSAYFELITSLERCVRRDIEREKPLIVDPEALINYLRTLAIIE